MLELTSLHNILNSMGDTAVHTDNSTRSRSRKTKCHSNIFDWVETGNTALVLYASINVKLEGGGDPGHMWGI